LEGLLTEKLSIARLFTVLTELCDSDLLRVSRTVRSGCFALLLLALHPRLIVCVDTMTPREDGGRDMMARRKIVEAAGYGGDVLLPNYEQRSAAVLTVGVMGSRPLYLVTRVAVPYIYFCARLHVLQNKIQ